MKVKVTPCHAYMGTGVGGGRKYISDIFATFYALNIFATSALEGRWPISATFRPLYHREISVTYFIAGI
jgi:hypothetical protein